MVSSLVLMETWIYCADCGMYFQNCDNYTVGGSGIGWIAVQAQFSGPCSVIIAMQPFSGTFQRDLSARPFSAACLHALTTL